MIVASNIIKRYGSKTVIKNFSYTFRNGLYFVVGKSGKGKTTLLNILSLKDENYKGDLVVKGSIFSLKDKDNLVNNLTVKEHFVLFEKVNNKKIEDIFNLNRLFNKKIKKLSLGEKQLVLLTIALNSENDNIILDEPLSALSKRNVNKACLFLKKVSENKTVILSTHNEEVFGMGVVVDFKKKTGKELCDFDDNKKKIAKRKLKINYLFMYFKKIFLKKMFFVLSLAIAILSFFCTNSYINKNINEYLEYFKVNEGVVINKKNTIKSINEDLFYELIKKLSLYVKDYNVNYYNSSLYDKKITVGNYYIGNGFSFSTVKYIEKDLKDNEIVVGLNYKDFCVDNGIRNCDEAYIETILVNKKLEDFPYAISEVFDNDELVILSNKRFFKLYENNEYEEYYFDINKEDKEEMFEKINIESMLDNFEFTLIGENKTNLRYKVEVKEYMYFKDINYNNYVVCLDKGYNCSDYINHFNSLIKIEDFREINKVEFKLIDKNLKINEVIISSGLNKFLKKKEGDKIALYFNYNDEIIETDLVLNQIIDNEKVLLYHNSDWSYLFFKDVLKYKESDLRIKNILIYGDVNQEDYQSENLYSELLNDFRKMFVDMKKSILFVSFGMSLVNAVILVFLEIYQNKFKREYFRYLEILNVEIKKHSRLLC